MKGDRIHLRIINKSDLDQMIAWLNTDEISQVMGYLPIFTIENQTQWYEEMISTDNTYVFAICINDSNKHIGNVGLGNIDYINRNAMLNIFIADKEMQGKGYGTETIRLILKFAFNRLNLHRIYLQTSERFTAALKMYEKIGFIKEGIKREHYYRNGDYEDKLLFSILRDEFIQ